MLEVTDSQIALEISEEQKIHSKHVQQALQFFQEGSTVPFVARYRKEATGGMDEVQLRQLQERHEELKDFYQRRQTILTTLQKQGKLEPELQKKIMACRQRSVLEDLYLPYKPKRRTRASVARDKGLEPLATLLLQGSAQSLADICLPFLDSSKEIITIEEALAGAKDIVAEWASEDVYIRQATRDLFLEKGILVACAKGEQDAATSKFRQYFNFSEAVKSIVSHRFLAIRRGEKEGQLKVEIQVDDAPIVAKMKQILATNAHKEASKLLEEAFNDACQRLLWPSVETETRLQLKMRSDKQAAQTFADNLKHLLMSPLLGQKNVLGIDPGLRTGLKCAAIGATGAYLAHATLHICQSEDKTLQAQQQLLAMLEKHAIEVIAFGNGTGTREAETFVRQSIKGTPFASLLLVQVNEAGASVYSASDIAREEFPELDVTIRGAISIGRRLQDPLAEWVKIEPKAIGIGQYQHDVNQTLLDKKLNDVIESCVHAVGVELNTASYALLSHVSGIGSALAKNIVQLRDRLGGFKSRIDLLEIPGLGPRTFEQAAGFLRIRNSPNPLDNSAVHPERYALVQQMANDLHVDLRQLIGDESLLSQIKIENYMHQQVGAYTLKDILEELQKPGRDPRAHFVPPAFREDITSITDLKIGMHLEGIISNVTAFGAFVDIGVHQDGLVHISQLADQFVQDPHQVVKVGQKIKVWVIDIDLPCKRIGLSSKSQAPLASSQKVQNKLEAGAITAQEDRQKKTRGNKDNSSPKDRTRASHAFKHNPFAKLQLK